MALASLDFLVLLRAAWMGALVFVGFGFAVLFALIVKRSWQEARLRRLEPLQRTARQTLLRWAGGGANDAALRPLGRLARRDLGDLLDELDQMLRGESRERLAVAGRLLKLDRYLLARLRRGLPGTRADAARRLGLYDDGATKSALKRALGDRQQAVRYAAAEALLGLNEDHADLAHRVLAGPSKTAPAARRFFTLLARKDGALVVSLLQASRDPNWQCLLIEALAEAGEGGAAEALVALSRPGRVVEVRASALLGLVRLRSRKAKGLAKAALEDEHPKMRRLGLLILAGLGVAPYREALRRLEAEAEGRIGTRAKRLLNRTPPHEGGTAIRDIVAEITA